MSTSSLRGLVSLADAATMLGIGESTTKRYAQAGRLRGTHIGNSPTSPWVFTRSEVLRFARIPRPVGYPRGKSRGKRR